MKVGGKPIVWLKEKGIASGLSYADALHDYLVEDIILRIYDSDYREVIWLKQEKIASVMQLSLYYLEKRFAVNKDSFEPGRSFTVEHQRHIMEVLFSENDKEELSWRGQIDQNTWLLRATFHEMEIPCSLHFEVIGEYELRQESVSLPLFFHEETISVLVCSAENQLATNLYEIIKKLELISDMKAYDMVNRILKEESISGRHVIEIFEDYTKKEPRVLREKRMKQIAEYKTYAYMRKRWEQYKRANAKEDEPWEEVVDRIVSFAEPVWTALCRQEIFFDDWMPELGRFLG